VVYVVDRSTSMQSRKDETIRVFDNEIKKLAEDSEKFNQETRVSVYLFGSRVECVVYDMDVLRLPSLKELYKIEGMTKLIDATVLAIEDLKQTPDKYGDHSFLVYVLTDGMENESHTSPNVLADDIRSLQDNWTFAVFVPDRGHVGPTARFGFPQDNIAVWSTSKGLSEVGSTIRTSTQNFMKARSMGVRGSKSLFTLDLSTLSASKVARSLQELAKSQYKFYPITKTVEIRDFVEGKTKNYVTGKSFYQLMKKETIQPYKQVCVVDKQGRVFGGREARKLLGLPDENVYVSPTQHPELDIFVQSTSVNRHLIPGTKLLVLQ
jgi:hypothetical protein